MLEQKLFFTRNGEYTIWEKIDSLNEKELDNVLEYIRCEMKAEIEPLYEISRKKRAIYSFYGSSANKDSAIENVINLYFSLDNVSKSDFNATLYKIDLKFTDIELGYSQLQKVKVICKGYGIENLVASLFIKKVESCIDIRFSSNKMSDYKDNSNEQIINTEVRIYFNLGLILVTDYSDYTHSKTVKELLLNDIYKLLNDNFENKTSYKLSDITLRLLLKKSKKYASKFKFYVDDYLNVAFNVVEDMGTNPLDHAGLREFYDKHKISGIKIAMNSNEDICIYVDGDRGKLITRTKNMEVKYIDEFIILLNDVIKYDYLNFDYKKNIKDAAMRALIGHTAQKISLVEDVYKIVEDKIMISLGDKSDIETLALVRNTFFYCLVNRRLVKDKIDVDNELESGVVKQLSKWLNVEKKVINSTFDYLIKIAMDSNESILEDFDEFINSRGEVNVN